MRFKVLPLILILSLLLCGCVAASAPSEPPTETTIVTEPTLSAEEREVLRVVDAVKSVQSENSFTFLAIADPDAEGGSLAAQASDLIQQTLEMDFAATLDTSIEKDSLQDLADSKTRVITLNTTEETGLTMQQLQWFAEALDLSGKADAKDWGILILSHKPLDFGGLLDTAGRMLDAYLSGTAVSFTVGEETVTSDFAEKNEAEIIGNIHGYSRCLRRDNLYLANEKTGMYPSPIVRICIPNAGSEGTNRFGTNSTTDSNGIEYGEAETYEKVPGTEKATAFNVVTVDRVKKVIYCANYGAGYDREISYGDGLLSEISVIDPPEGTYTNQVPISTEFGRRNNTIFNETGYRNHTYLVCNDIDEEPWPYGNDAEYVTTGAIPFTVPSYLTPPVIYIWGAELDEADHTRFFIYDSQKYRLVLQATGAEFKNYFTIEQLGDQYYKLTPIPEGKASVLFPATNGRAGKGSIAFSLKGTGENLVITVGEPIIPE